MTLAFVFPGQGSQVIGMGRALAEAYPAARAVFDEVDEALGEKLSALVWEGDIETLTLTQNAQPALMATSMAAVRALEAEGVPVTAASFVAGHSLGGALSCRVAQRQVKGMAGMVLVGTTHPKTDNLSNLKIPVTKIYGSEDGVAPPWKVEANMHLLPSRTIFIKIEGANHSQFGHYGEQFRDGEAGITRENQHEQTRRAIVNILKELRPN